MIYNLKTDYNKAISSLVRIAESEHPIVEIKHKKKKRSLQQNRALHLFFTQLAKELNDLGLTFNYTGLKGVELEAQFTDILVKETVWRPIQMALFGIKSTTELETHQINKILDVLSNFFADRGVSIHFPSQIDLIAKEFEKNGIY